MDYTLTRTLDKALSLFERYVAAQEKLATAAQINAKLELSKRSTADQRTIREGRL